MIIKIFLFAEIRQVAEATQHASDTWLFKVLQESIPELESLTKICLEDEHLESSPEIVKEELRARICRAIFLLEVVLFACLWSACHLDDFIEIIDMLRSSGGWFKVTPGKELIQNAREFHEAVMGEGGLSVNVSFELRGGAKWVGC